MRYDVVVVGGGASGAAAAAAAQSGAQVCLVERHGFLGGAAVASSVLTYCGFFDRNHEQVVAGVGQQFLDGLDQNDLYVTHTSSDSGNKIVLLDPETTKRVFNALVADSGVTVFLHAQVVTGELDADQVTSISFVHAGGLTQVSATAFVDCSGDGALLAGGRIPTSVAAVDARQASTLVMRVGGVADDADLSRSSVMSAIAQYRTSQQVILPRDRGSLIRLPVSGEILILIADQHRDMLDVAEASLAEIEGRRLAMHYFCAMSASMRGWSGSFLSATGPQIGVRETRRLVGMETLVERDVATARKRPEQVVARGGWPMENHVQLGRTRYGGIAGGGTTTFHKAPCTHRRLTTSGAAADWSAPTSRHSAPSSYGHRVRYRACVWHRRRTLCGPRARGRCTTPRHPSTARSTAMSTLPASAVLRRGTRVW